MTRQPQRSTRTDTRCPDPVLFRAWRARVRDFEACLGVAGVDVQALGFGLVPLAVDAGVRLLRLHALVIEPGMVEVDLGGAPGHVEPVFGADAPVMLVSGRVARAVGSELFDICVFLMEGTFIHTAFYFVLVSLAVDT